MTIRKKGYDVPTGEILCNWEQLHSDNFENQPSREQLDSVTLDDTYISYGNLSRPDTTATEAICRKLLENSHGAFSITDMHVILSSRLWSSTGSVEARFIKRAILKKAKYSYKLTPATDTLQNKGSIYMRSVSASGRYIKSKS